LHDWHVEHQARMTDFAGWSMPIQYISISDEHLATRRSAALFDVSHMGRLRFYGSDAAAFLNRLLTRRIDDLADGRIRYTLATTDAGTVLDDLLVYRLVDLQGRPFMGVVVNAGNREKMARWFQSHLGAADVSFQDETFSTAMIAVQGPSAVAIVQRLCDELVIDQMRYFSGTFTRCAGASAFISRTGYTGEDGVEITIAADQATRLWSELMRVGREPGITAAGLGARDTLRLEAGMPLYGHELSEQINAAQTDLDFALDLADRQFPGRDAICSAQADRSLPRRIGLTLEGKRVPRQHHRITSPEGKDIGEVSSGTFSPSLGYPIAMGYVLPEYASVGTNVWVDIRGRPEPAQVVRLPFYRRNIK
jgi:aminomethyltransferase